MAALALCGACILFDNNNLDLAANVAAIAGDVATISILINSTLYMIKSNELKELQKYQLFLKNIDKLEKNSDNPNLFMGIKSPQRKLNINTLDDFSKKDITRIITNLKRYEEIESLIS